jgi:hypothetical protein
MDGWMVERWMDGCMGGFLNEWMDEWMKEKGNEMR